MIKEKNYLLRDTYIFMREELKRIEDILSKEIPRALRQAYDTGGYWHDNPHWDYTLQDQEKLRKRYYQILGPLNAPAIIEEEIRGIDFKSVWIGTEVTIRDEEGKEESWKVVGSFDTVHNPHCKSEEGFISYKAPLIAPLIGKKRGEEVKIILPLGRTRRVRIVDIRSFVQEVEPPSLK
ncbi:MAG: GreA/GreB family elongation factor [Candidatus Pacebacteria bacterium]|nr:GreA/GreB family elongation factor [Candidatus Paceibacterota bacterium]